MEKRKAKRITIGFNADIAYEGKSYRGITENLSESGAGIITDPIDITADFKPGTKLEMRFQPQPGESILLDCKIMWVNNVSSNGKKQRVGMIIIDPPWENSSFFL